MKDYATSTVMVAPFPSDTGTSLTVTTGHEVRFPEPPFKASVFPNGAMPTLDNAEKVLVTAKNGDTFTIERGLGDTNPKFIQAGFIFSNALFAEDFQAVLDFSKVPGPDGNDGREVEIQNNGTHIQYRYVGDVAWINLAALADLTGGQGADGSAWFNGPDAPLSTLGSIGDFYLENLNGNVYEKTDAITWTIVANIKGPSGSSSGDMSAATYDPAGGSRQVAFADELGSGGVTDHGLLTGLADDDHPQYALANGTRGSFAATTHTHTVSQVTDFDTAVANNTTVAANTTARHTHSNSAVLNATTASFLLADETKLDGIQAGAQVNSVASVAGKTGAVTLAKADVGLGSVDNTSDATKKTDIMRTLYPVGTIYTNKTNATNPGTLLGFGTWVAIQDRFIYGAGTKLAGDTGGAEMHTLTEAEMPSHTHGLNDGNLVMRASSGSRNQIGTGTNATYSTLSVAATGGGVAHNNMPPFTVAYMWERTA